MRRRRPARFVCDGSSTVAPLTSAAAELFRSENPNVNVTVATSGTGGGFEQFCSGSTDISNASRAIEDDEKARCQQSGVEFVELQVANDALTVVVNPENNWANCLTVQQLATIWGPQSERQVTSWNQVDPSFPAEPIALFGPGTDSGTFDYFTDEINGEEGAPAPTTTPRKMTTSWSRASKVRAAHGVLRLHLLRGELSER